MSLPEWEFGHGAPSATGVIRKTPEDFRVWEQALVQPSGEGNHVWLELEKRGANTDWVAGQLARAAGVARRDVGYAGMKDRHGVTTQWFSVGLQEASQPDWEHWQIPDVTVISALRHGRKLKRGALRGNRFHLVVRDVTGSADELQQRLEQVAAEGVPNYFGAQRFGHEGRNVAQAVRWLEKGGRLARNRRGIYLSAARSFLFNQVLSERVRQGNWNLLMDGDLAQLDGSRSVFPCSLPDVTLEQRCREFDIHPTGPLPGRSGRDGALPVRAAAGIEQDALKPHEGLVAGLVRAGAEAARRSLRLKPEALEWHLEGQRLELQFGLPSGAYATSVLRELLRVSDAMASSVRMPDPEQRKIS